MKKSIRFLVGALAVLVACGAHATPIMKWQLELWTRFDTSPTSLQPLPGVTVLSNQSLRWGDNDNDSSTPPDPSLQSGLDITPTHNMTSQLTTLNYTNGPAVDNTSITHRNQPIFGDELEKVTILSTLTLTPFDPFTDNLLLPPPVNQATIPYFVDFQETLNDPGSGVCADGAENRVKGKVNENGCADIFVIDKVAVGLQFDYPDPDAPSYLRTYFISFFESSKGVGRLSSAACLAATGKNLPCIGIETREKLNTTIKFAARITTVPEPTTVLLMGLGLAGLGFARWRRLNG